MRWTIQQTLHIVSWLISQEFREVLSYNKKIIISKCASVAKKRSSLPILLVLYKLRKFSR